MSGAPSGRGGGGGGGGGAAAASAMPAKAATTPAKRSGAAAASAKRRGIGRRKLRARLAGAAAAREAAAESAAGAAALLRTDLPGLLVPDRPLERTHALRQPALVAAVDAASQRRAAFALDLAHSRLAPYHTARYARSGRGLLVASRKGHVAAADWRSAALHAELHLNETVHDAVFLHSDAFFALAQKSYVHIYDASGTQLHVLRKHRHAAHLAFLPYHFLLASATGAAADAPQIAWTDTSTGTLVAAHNYGARALALGPASALAASPATGVLHAAHANGVVSLWAPSQGAPLARFLAHPGGVRRVALAPDGHTILTAGADATVRAWDARMFRPRAAWALPAPPAALAISQRGLVAAAFGATVHVWASIEPARGRTAARAAASAIPTTDPDADLDASRPRPRTPYMVQQYPSTPVTGLDFCPFEDVLAVCHVNGMASMLVPGAGEPVFDSAAPNPYATRKTRREAEVRALLDKLPPETIALDVSNIGGVDPDPAARLNEMRARVREEATRAREKMLSRRRAKGRGKISKQLARKQKNVIDAKRVELLEKREKERRNKQTNNDGTPGQGASAEAPVLPALKRFYPKQQR